MFEIKVKITTVSNCMMGSQTDSFSVGGVDQATTMDENKKPIIHGSAFKGVLRNIVRDIEKDSTKMKETKEYVKSLLIKVKDKYTILQAEEADEKNADGLMPNKPDKLDIMISKLETYIENPKAEYIFGMEGINGLPRLFFSDFRVCQANEKEEKDYFLIETKNKLEEENGEILSKPRTYRVVKPGVEFEGNICFQNFFFQNHSEELKNMELKVKEELETAVEEFNFGFYRIGNSKSRGYGQIQVEISNRKGNQCLHTK
ncbi:MAG: RAMP superfamily CRISPR-associated protein [Eubacteriales bacterium]|nr:RAMP superfamily CRISPR-associated protein [Eubacteriales bacterium]